MFYAKTNKQANKIHQIICEKNSEYIQYDMHFAEF